MSNLDGLLAFAQANFAPIQLALGAVAGFVATRFTMTKKERADTNQKIYENGRELMLAQNQRFQEFAAALHKYSRNADPGVEDFVAISVSGDTYFNQLMMNANAVLSHKVSNDLRDNTIVPRIVEAIESNLPAYYSTLQSIAVRKGFPYGGTLDRNKYEALYAVAEKFGRAIKGSRFSADANLVSKETGADSD